MYSKVSERSLRVSDGAMHNTRAQEQPIPFVKSDRMSIDPLDGAAIQAMEQLK
jgi:hypothetical protein